MKVLGRGLGWSPSLSGLVAALEQWVEGLGSGDVGPVASRWAAVFDVSLPRAELVFSPEALFRFDDLLEEAALIRAWLLLLSGGACGECGGDASRELLGEGSSCFFSLRVVMVSFG